MLGYCVQNDTDTESMPFGFGVVAIQEYAPEDIPGDILQSWPFQQRLKTAIELADLLHYIEHSPLGSLHMWDFKYAHFRLKDGQVKVTNIDGIGLSEKQCQSTSKICKFGIQCEGGFCEGYNAKANIANMHRLFFAPLLFRNTSGEVVDRHRRVILDELQRRLDTNSISALEIKEMLSTVRNA